MVEIDPQDLPHIWERSPDEGRRRLKELHELTRGAMAEMRTLLVELRPSSLVEAPLGDLLRQLGEAFTGRARVPVTLEIEEICPLPPDVQVTLYRIAQEALNNALRHAEATKVAVSIRAEAGHVQLEVIDDGGGFDVGAAAGSGGIGLQSMRERAQSIGGSLEVWSELGEGTCVRARIPLDQ